MYKKVLSIVLVMVLFSTMHGNASAMSLGDFFNTIINQFSFSPTSVLEQAGAEEKVFLPAPDDEVVQEQSGDISVSFEGLFYDKSNEKWTRDWSGESRQDRSTIVNVNGTNYLVQVMSKTGAYGYPSNPTSHDYLAVFSLNDPYHPALVGEIDMTAYSKSHSSGLNPLSPCDIGDMEAVEYNGALRGFVAGGCRTSNNRLATAYKAWFTLSQDGDSNALQITKYDVTTTNDDNILDDDPTSFIGGALFKGSDGRLYSFAVKPRYRNNVLVIHDVTSTSNHTVVYESNDLYENNLIAPGNHGGYIFPEVPAGVIYSGNTPYIVMTDLEFPGWINNVWTSIIDVSNVFAPRFVFQGVDNTWFTNAPSPQAAGCVEGCDRTLFERTVLEYHYAYMDGMWRSNGPEQYGIGSIFLDEVNNRIYRPAWDKWICADHTFECVNNSLYDLYSGDVRYRYQIGVLDMTNPSSPARVAQPIIGSQKWNSITRSIVRAPGPFYNNNTSMQGNSGILLNTMPFIAKYDFLIMSIYESDGVTAQRGNRVGYVKDGTYYWDTGSQHAFEQMYASMNDVPGALVFDGLEGDQRRLTSGNILQISNGEYAAYVSLAGGAVGAFSIVTDGSGGGGSVGGDDNPVGLGNPSLSSGGSVFSPSNLLRFFRRVLGL
jgi:hypothetical protein